VRLEVAALLDGAAILRLAEPSDYDRGRALVDLAAVELDALTPSRVLATVRDLEPQQVELRATPRGLEWWCSCESGRTGVFCLHVVATAFATWRRATSPQGESGFRP
jgi:uncharacterized Zn finger protein